MAQPFRTATNKKNKFASVRKDAAKQKKETAPHGSAAHRRPRTLQLQAGTLPSGFVGVLP
jgi:hypothetical protein